MLLLQLSTALCMLSTTIALALPKAEPQVVEVTVVEETTEIELTTDVIIDETVEISTGGLTPICTNLNTLNNGCIRYVLGFDVTGVVSEVDLTFPQIQDACDCIQACLDLPGTCAAYVWKFSTPESVTSGHRTCTLYSQFNLPANVTLEFDLASDNNTNINAAEIMQNGNNPQAGAAVIQTFMDINLNTTVDNQAVSGEVWQLSTGGAIC